MPADLFDLVASELEPGKPVTDAQVRKIIARLYTDGSGWFSESYADALRKEKEHSGHLTLMSQRVNAVELR